MEIEPSYLSADVVKINIKPISPIKICWLMNDCFDL